MQWQNSSWGENSRWSPGWNSGRKSSHNSWGGSNQNNKTPSNWEQNKNNWDGGNKNNWAAESWDKLKPLKQESPHWAPQWSNNWSGTQTWSVMSTQSNWGNDHKKWNNMGANGNKNWIQNDHNKNNLWSGEKKELMKEPATPSTRAPDSPVSKGHCHLQDSLPIDAGHLLQSTTCNNALDFWSRGLDWSIEGIPQVYRDSLKKKWEMPVLDWSSQYPPRAFYDAMKPELGAVDWSSTGVPYGLWGFWDSPVLDWSSKHFPEVFRKARWEEQVQEEKHYPCDWTVKGMPQIFEVGSRVPKNSEEECVDWSRDGVVKKWKFWDFQLNLDWSENGNPPLPAYVNRKTSKYEPLCVDWSVEGIPRQVKDAPWGLLFNRDQLIVDWSGRGMPKPFRVKANTRIPKKLLEQIEHIDWSVNAIPFQFELGKRVKTDDAIDSVDWSGNGIPKNYLRNGLSPNSLFVNNMDGAIFDWSTVGLPQMFAGITKGQEHTDKVKSIDWSCTGQPWQFVQMEKDISGFSAVDWSCYGVPLSWNMWDNEGIVDWSRGGIPPLIKKANYAPRYGDYFMPTPTGSNINITLFANGVPNLFQGPKKAETLKKKMKSESEWIQLGEVVFEKKLSRGGDRQRLTNAERSMLTYIEQWDYSRMLFWEEQGLDFSCEGLPAMFRLEKERKICDESRLRHIESLAVDWSCFGLPLNLREDGFWDSLAVDWSIARLPKICYENRTRDYQFDPMILDWSKDGIPSEIRHVWGGRIAAIETPLLDWSADGIPKLLANVARETGRRNKNPFDGDELFAVDWGCDKLPYLAWKAQPYEEPIQIDFSGPGIPSEFRVGDGFWDDLGVDWNSFGVPFYQEYADNIAIKEYALRKKMLAPEISWVNWSKSGRPRYLRLGVGKPYCLDWSCKGIPREMDGAEWLCKGSNMPTTQLDWSSEGVPRLFIEERKWRRNKLVFDWSGSGVPFPKDITKAFYEETLDWSCAGIPRQILQGKTEFLETVDWSGAGVPVMVRNLFDREFQLDWSVVGLPVEIDICKRDTILEREGIDWSIVGLPYMFRKINFSRGSEFDVTCVDWSNKGMPLVFQTLQKWDQGLRPIDWSCRGVPIITQYYDVSIYDRWSVGVDWTKNGVPYSDYFDDAFHENINKCFCPSNMKKRELNQLQLSHADSLGVEEYLGILKNASTKQKCLDSPWNRCKDERREARFLYRVNHTKKSKRHLKLLLNIDAAQAYKMLIMVKKRQRTLDKNQRRKEKDAFLGVLE